MTEPKICFGVFDVGMHTLVLMCDETLLETYQLQADSFGYPLLDNSEHLTLYDDAMVPHYMGAHSRSAFSNAWFSHGSALFNVSRQEGFDQFEIARGMMLLGHSYNPKLRSVLEQFQKDRKILLMAG